jgi:hypothetical protein
MLIPSNGLMDLCLDLVALAAGIIFPLSASPVAFGSPLGLPGPGEQ